MNHLELRVSTGEKVRDDLRDELGRYAYDAIMLDGVEAGVHQRLVINNSYHLDQQVVADSLPTQSESLLDELAEAAA